MACMVSFLSRCPNGAAVTGAKEFATTGEMVSDNEEAVLTLLEVYAPMGMDNRGINGAVVPTKNRVNLGCNSGLVIWSCMNDSWGDPTYL